MIEAPFREFFEQFDTLVPIINLPNLWSWLPKPPHELTHIVISFIIITYSPSLQDIIIGNHEPEELPTKLPVRDILFGELDVCISQHGVNRL